MEQMRISFMTHNILFPRVRKQTFVMTRHKFQVSGGWTGESCDLLRGKLLKGRGGRGLMTVQLI